MWRVVLVLVCFWPAWWIAAASEHRRHSDFFYGTGGQLFCSKRSAHGETFCRAGTRPSSQCSYWKPWGWGGEIKNFKKKDLARSHQRLGPSGTLPSGTREMDVNFLAEYERRPPFFLFFFYFLETCTHLSVLSLPPCLFYLVRLKSIGNVSCLAWPLDLSWQQKHSSEHKLRGACAVFVSLT